MYELNKLHEGISYENYHSSDGLRAGYLSHLRRSPAHLKASIDNPGEPTEALEFGRLFHQAMENPQRFLDLIIVEPTFVGKTKDGRDSERSAEAKLKREEWIRENSANRIVLKEAVADMLTGMLQACLSHRVIGGMFREGVRETSLWVTDDETGETLKCRPDFVNSRGHIVDIKTTRDASRGFFTREIFRSTYSNDRFYALSGAHYAHCAKLSKACRDDAIVYVAIEKEPPYGIMIYPIDRGGLDVGERARRPLTKLYSECRKKNEWKCYPEKVTPVEIPTWVQWVDEEESWS